MITLDVAFSEDIGLWYFVVREAGAVLHFRPGFRSQAAAQQAGEAWIQQHTGASPTDDRGDSC